MRMLIVEDEEALAKGLRFNFEQEGFEVSLAGDGTTAVRMFEESAPPYEVVILDLMLPGMSGYEVCQRLKSDPQTRNISIIMVTALAEMGDIEKAVNAGANDFLTKPVNKLELITRVKTLLELRHVKSELDRLLKYMEGVEGSHGTSG